MKMPQGNFRGRKDSLGGISDEEAERFRPLTPYEELQVCALLCKYGGKHCVENLENNTNVLCVKHLRIFFFQLYRGECICYTIVIRRWIVARIDEYNFHRLSQVKILRARRDQRRMNWQMQKRQRDSIIGKNVPLNKLTSTKRVCQRNETSYEIRKIIHQYSIPRTRAKWVWNYFFFKLRVPLHRVKNFETNERGDSLRKCKLAC